MSSRVALTGCAAAVLILLGTAVVALGQTGVSVSGVLNAKYLYDTQVDASAVDSRLDLEIVAGKLKLGEIGRAHV